MIIDPPEGWKYGFPARQEEIKGLSDHENFLITLSRHKYPFVLYPMAMRATRMWEENRDKR